MTSWYLSAVAALTRFRTAQDAVGIGRGGLELLEAFEAIRSQAAALDEEAVRIDRRQSEPVRECEMFASGCARLVTNPLSTGAKPICGAAKTASIRRLSPAL
jgi:hypothetical protein